MSLVQAMGDRAQLYYDYVWAALSDAAREALDMLPQKHEYQHEGLRRAKAEGLAQGITEGKALGLLDLIEVRGLSMTPAQRARILGCTDLERLRAWIASAAIARSVDDVLGV